MRRSSSGVSSPDPKVDLVVEVDSAGHRSSRARDARRTLGHRCQFGVDDVFVDRAETGEGAEAAVAAGNHPIGADHVCETLQTLRDEFGVLDEVVGGVEHAGDQHFV